MVLMLLQQEHLRREMESPTPGWLDVLMHWAFQEVPQWVQLGGAILVVVLLVAAVTLAWWRREAILGWWDARSRGFRTGVVATVVLVVLVAGVMGLRVWDYMQHDNEFCNSCHVMAEPYEKFQTSEHSELLCHDCHQQSMFASARQLYLWVLDRPEEIGPHAPVPTGVCVDCHVTEDPDSTWQRIAATAGHRVHLEADTSALEDVMCVTCHGQEVHRFVPADETCGQSGCHEPGRTQIVLGEMAGQTGFHCVGCHEFTAPVVESAALDTARMALTPQLEACRSCHEMRDVLAGMDPEVDPHDAVCGTCHNPHTQEAPDAATQRCAECHAPADTLTPFHQGLDTGVLENCQRCHPAHTFQVEGEDCRACHIDLTGATPPAAPGARMEEEEETAEAVDPGGERAAVPPGHPAVRLVHGSAPAPSPDRGVARAYVGLRTGSDPALAPLQQVSGFDHADHEEIECTACHSVERTHGAIELESRGECMDCHHTRPVVNVGCASCHGRAELAAPLTVGVRMTFAGRARTRSIVFDHDDHRGERCATCHTGGTRLEVTRGCESCHSDHHSAEAACVRCHADPAADAHTREVHTRGCAGSGCHEDESYGAMNQGRNTCLGCHQEMADHRPGRGCAECHRVSFAAADPPPTGRRR
ncbi:MAG: NapC/NirT family cytochrome c [Gemmatimonadota bacterium]|nr:NapC/NirT family cytochrome c [Gemmatimonadota bacterium]